MNSELIILGLIPSFLYINSDIEERQTRAVESNEITHNAIEELVNSNKSSMLWFRLDCTYRDNQLKNIPHPLIRKFRRAAHPTPESIVFYWLPWILVFYFQCSSKRNLNAF